MLASAPVKDLEPATITTKLNCNVSNGYIPHTEDLQNAFNSYSRKSLFESLEALWPHLKALVSSLASMADLVLASISTTMKMAILVYVSPKALKDLVKGV
jgi:hypothetical protein